MTDEEIFELQQEEARRELMSEVIRDAQMLRKLALAAPPVVDDTALLAASLIAAASRIAGALDGVADAIESREGLTAVAETYGEPN